MLQARQAPRTPEKGIPKLVEGNIFRKYLYLDVSQCVLKIFPSPLRVMGSGTASGSSRSLSSGAAWKFSIQSSYVKTSGPPNSRTIFMVNIGRYSLYSIIQYANRFAGPWSWPKQWRNPSWRCLSLEGLLWRLKPEKALGEEPQWVCLKMWYTPQHCHGEDGD